MPSTEVDGLFQGAARYRPTAVVTARRLTEPLTWHTEGGATLSAQPGDWELTDADGDRWTVEPAAFARSYRRRPDGRYAKHEFVDAVRVAHGIDVPTTEGPSTARPGDWLLRDAGGAVWPVPDHTFRDRYSPVEPHGENDGETHDVTAG